MMQLQKHQNLLPSLALSILTYRIPKKNLEVKEKPKAP